MTSTRPMTPNRTIALAVVVTSAIVAVAACQSGAPGGSPSPSSSLSPPPSPTGSRPSSPAVIKIVQPAAGASVTGKTLHIVISLEGAQIVAATTTDVRPDQGHVHLYVDNSLVSMNYGLEQDIAVHPGTYVIKAEFVASDHAPFSPRVWSPEVFFTVK